MAYAIIIILMILFFDIGTSKNSDITENETINISKTTCAEDATIGNGTIDEKSNTTISLDRALELLYNDEKNENVEVYEKDIDHHVRIIHNVSFSGTYSDMDFDSFYIDNVVTENKTYNNVKITTEVSKEDSENYKNQNVDNLRIGDKVDVICSIVNGLDFIDDSVKDRYREEYDDFSIYYPQYSDSENKKLIIKTYRDDKDELLDKYSDKDKIYDLYEFYDDLATISNENLKRSDKIFYGIKFRVTAKCTKQFNVYDHYYLQYDIKNDNMNIGDEKLRINSQYNFIGTNDNNESKYSLTKKYFSLPIKSLLNDKEYKYKDYNREQALKLENKEVKKGYQDFIFKYTTTYTSDIQLINLTEELSQIGTLDSNGKSEEYINDTTKESTESSNGLKKIGNDKTIDIGDRVLFGNNLCWDVVDIDYKDKNKILIMLTDDSVKDNIPTMSWTSKESSSYLDSDVRKYLNDEFLNEYFTNEEKNRMFTTTLDVSITEYNGKTSYDTLSDKLFILSDDDIDEYKYTLTNPIDTSYVRNQRYGIDRASMYRRNKIINDEFKQETNNYKEKWYVYPLVWINIS